MSKFKNSSGQLLLKELFYEVATNPLKPNVLYTLKEEDHKGYPSLKRLYMSYIDSDPTEYSFAKDHLYSWNHWEKLMRCSWFKEYLDAWRFEKDLAIKSNALKGIMEEAAGGGKNALSANKYLIEKNFTGDDKKNNVGRPSRDAIKQEAQILYDRDKELEEDYNRISLLGEMSNEREGLN